MYKLLLVGRTASGKDTIANELMRAGLKPVTSFTTRPKREGEGTTHRFITEEEVPFYPDKVATTEINGYHYFATRRQIEEADFYIIDPNGVKALVSNMPDTLFRLVYIKADDEIRQERFASRDPAKADIFKDRDASEDEQFTSFELSLFERNPVKEAKNLLQYRIEDNSGNNAYLDIANRLIADRRLFEEIRKVVNVLVKAGAIYKNEDGLALVMDTGTEYVSTDVFAEHVLSDDIGIATLIKSYVYAGNKLV